MMMEPQLYDYGAQLRSTPFPAPLNTTPMHTNPLAAGVQLGMLGAAAGLGVAGVQRALRLKAGNQVAPPVLRAMLVGSVIGAGLGVAASLTTQPDASTSAASWPDLAAKIQNDLYGGMQKQNEYCGLTLLVEKQAGLAGTIINEGSYWLPGIGTVRMGWDAIKGYGNAIKSFAGGNVRQGFGRLSGALGNTLFAAASLATGGAALGRVAKLGRMGRALRIAAKGGRQARVATNLARGLKTTGRMGRRVARVASRIPARQLGQLQRASAAGVRGGRRFGGLKGMVGGMGLATGGGLLEGTGAEAVTTRAGRGIAATQPWLRQYQRPQIAVPR